MENKVYEERLEGRELDRWWRWIKCERGRDFQYTSKLSAKALIN